jgi:hypothetical protein
LNKSHTFAHDDFILGYQNGRLGCSVSALLTLRLFLAGQIREKQVSIRLVGWLLGLLFAFGSFIVACLLLPTLWALLGGIVLLAILWLGFTHAIGGLIVSAALSDEQFYQFAVTERALWVSADGEGNIPKLQKVVPLRDPRRAQR